MIAVTGVTGFIGKHFLKQALKTNFSIKILVGDKSKLSLRDMQKEKVTVSEGNLLLPISLSQFCEGTSCIIHIAGIVKPNKIHPSVSRVNVEGTKNLIIAAENANCTDFIYISSGAVDFLGGEYAESKRKAEKLVRDSKLNWIILRPTEIYGSGDINGITSLISKVKKFPFFPIIGKGDYLSQPLYVSDLVDAILKILNDKDRLQFKTITLAGPEAISFSNILLTIAKSMNKKLRLISIPKKIALFIASLIEKLPYYNFTNKAQIQRILVSKHWDISETKKLIDFTPMTFYEGIAKEINQQQKQ